MLYSIEHFLFSLYFAVRIHKSIEFGQCDKRSSRRTTRWNLHWILIQRIPACVYAFLALYNKSFEKKINNSMENSNKKFSNHRTQVYWRIFRKFYLKNFLLSFFFSSFNCYSSSMQIVGDIYMNTKIATHKPFFAKMNRAERQRNKKKLLFILSFWLLHAMRNGRKTKAYHDGCDNEKYGSHHYCVHIMNNGKKKKNH